MCVSCSALIESCPNWSYADLNLPIDNLLVRVHFIIAMIKWTGLAPWEFEFPFPGSLTSTFRSALIESCPNWCYADLNLPDASPAERAAAVSRRVQRIP